MTPAFMIEARQRFAPRERPFHIPFDLDDSQVFSLAYSATPNEWQPVSLTPWRNRQYHYPTIESAQDALKAFLDEEKSWFKHLFHLASGAEKISEFLEFRIVSVTVEEPTFLEFRITEVQLTKLIGVEEPK